MIFEHQYHELKKENHKNKQERERERDYTVKVSGKRGGEQDIIWGSPRH